jgi:NADH-quinone oxidoreductase subunit L
LATDAVRLTPQPGVFHMDVAVTSSLIAVAGFAVSAFLYLGRTNEASALAKLFSSKWLASPYLLAKGKFFWDEIYDVLIIHPIKLGSRICYWIDQYFVDGLVNLVGWMPRLGGMSIRGLQMGFVPFYALAMVLGIITLVASRIWWGG